MKIAGLKKTKKGSFATSASVLEDLAFKGHEFPKLILDWRQVSKLKNTYSDSLPEHINPKTKRVHTSFLLAATTTGRLASSDPNLQNIPIKTDDGREIRKAFVAEKNNVLISAHGNSIRALCKYLFNLDDEQISKLEIPTGNPLILKMDNKYNISNCEYLDQDRSKDLLVY